MSKTLRRADPFLVFYKALPNSLDQQIITLLYQPLMGHGAMTLYFLLLSLVNRQTLCSDLYQHYDLESLLSQSIERIEVYRHRLEAIGLLKTSILEDTFYYEIKSPLSPNAFVNDGLLGGYLQAILTESRFKKILKLFQIQTVRTELHQDISKSFNDVFQSLPTEPAPFQGDLINGSKVASIQFSHVDFDFSLFVESIPKGFFDESQFTEPVKHKIANLVYVYGLDELDMKDVYIKAIEDVTLKVDLNRLTLLAKDYYKLKVRKSASIEEQEALPRIKERPKDPIAYFKAVTPKVLLEDMQNGKVATKDLHTVASVLDQTGIDKHVLNVLIAYVFGFTNGKLPSFEYLEKEAIQWVNDGITSVESAVDYVKHLASEHDKKKHGGKKKSQKTTDVEISWLDDYLASIE